ncbi:MAG: AAA family ATPase [Bacteroidetes bacterium]|nr:AAA family ATPase [Bacteroidota bacterium]
MIIDEAQKIENIGSVLKLFTDYLKNTQVIATGSSSFEIKNKTNEPLTGRKWEYHLFPLSYSEMVEHTNVIEEKRLLTHRLIYGYYPEIVVHDDDLALRLKTLSESYLYKDILMWQDIKKPDKLVQLLKALAMQIGSEVNYHELGNIVGLKTIPLKSIFNC